MAKYSAFGTKIERGDGETPEEEFTSIGQVRNIGGPRRTVDTQDMTAHDSEGGYEEVVPTIKRSGDMNLEILYDPANATHQGLEEDYENRALRNFHIVFPDEGETTYEFAAYVTGFETEAAHDGPLTLNVTLKPSGAITLVED